MKVVYVLRQFPRTSETFVLREVRELARRGVDIDAWSLLPTDGGEPPAADAEEALRVTRYAPSGSSRVPALALAFGRLAVTEPRRLLAALGWALAWSAHERDWRHLAALLYAAWLAPRIPAEAHVHAHFANVPATVALLLGRLRGVSWSFTGHANDMFVGTSRRMLAHKVQAASVAVVGTEFARRYVRAVAGPASAAKVMLVRNGLDAAELAPDGDRPRAPRTLCCVGRLVEKKGVDTLIDAAAILRDRGEDVTVRVVGDGPLREVLEARARARGVDDCVHLLGARDARAVRDELAAASAFALPCRRDSSGDVDSGPLVIVEAMARRTPVITTRVGGIPETVVDGVSGILVEPDDPEGLADAISRVLADPELRARLGEGGRAIAERDALAPNLDSLLAGFAGARAG